MDNITAFITDPRWLAHRYDPEHDAVHFLDADRAARSRATFLTDEELRPAAPIVLKRDDAVAAAPPAATVHFIFHSAYCCSTLLARAFDLPGVASTLKEPQILNDLVGWRHRGGSPRAIAPVLSDAIHLLSRPFQSDEMVIIKPSNVVSGLIEPILGLHQTARAVMLHAPIRTFVTSIARKGMWGRIWVRDLLSKLMTDGLIHMGFTPRDYLLLTDLQAAAVGWLAQQSLFEKIAAAVPDRVRLVDSERLVDQPDAQLARIIRHLGVPVDDATIADIVAREFSRDAKGGGRFAKGQREQSQQQGEQAHAEEINKVVQWAHVVAENASILVEPAQQLYV